MMLMFESLFLIVTRQDLSACYLFQQIFSRNLDLETFCRLQ